MKLFQEDLIKNLPDCYNKSQTSNFYKLMQLFQYDSDKFKITLQDLDKSLSLDDSEGYTLDLYGEMYGQPRSGMTDEQYRIAIRQKMAIYMCKSDIKSIVNVLSFVVGAPVKEFILEDAASGGNIDVKMFPYDKLQEAGITLSQAQTMLETLLPAGVRSTGFKITQSLNDMSLNVASALTLAEKYECNITCQFNETINSDTVTAKAAVTHNETYILEVLN